MDYDAYGKVVIANVRRDSFDNGELLGHVSRLIKLPFRHVVAIQGISALSTPDIQELIYWINGH